MRHGLLLGKRFSVSIGTSSDAFKLLLDAKANPADDEDGLAVTDRLVAWAVRAFVGGFATIGDAGVIAGEALKPFALARGEPPDRRHNQGVWLIPSARCRAKASGHVVASLDGAPATSAAQRNGHNGLATARAVFAGVKALGLQRVRDIPADAHCDLAAGVGVTGSVPHGSECWGEAPGVGAVVLAAEGEQGVFLATVPAQRVGQAVKHIGILCAVHDQHPVFCVLLGRAAGCLSICLQSWGDQMARHGVIHVATAISASKRAGDTILDAERLALHVHSGVLGRERGGLADIAVKAVAAVSWNAGQHLNRWAFVTLAVRAAIMAEV